MTERCGKKYGARRHLICRRLAGHAGNHALRLSLHELRKVLQ